MYAVVNIKGKQFKVSPNRYVYAPCMKKEVGDTIELDNPILVAPDDGEVQLGTPFLDKVRVEAKVMGHHKGDKTIVFKKKRRKGYAVKRGHRQRYTKLLIQSISVG